MADKNKSQIAGADQFLSSEVLIGGGQLICNSLFADWWRKHFSDHASEVTACLKKSKSWTGVTKIGGALWSTSWDLIDPATESSICEKAMSMNVPSQLNNFGRSSRGYHER